jgi:hypothetical protein
MGVMGAHQLFPKNRFVALFLSDRELLEDFRLLCKRKTREDDRSQVSTELTLSCGVSCGFHTGAKKPKATETNNSSSLLTKFSMENPHEEEEEEEVSTALKLYDESWVNPKGAKATKDSAVNSMGEEKSCDSGLQTCREEEGTPQEGQERSESLRTLNLFEIKIILGK